VGVGADTVGKAQLNGLKSWLSGNWVRELVIGCVGSDAGEGQGWESAVL
jgi:hypothetical protein